jgi:hypothetical protein
MRDDPWVELAESGARCFTYITGEGLYLPDMISWARYLPAWTSIFGVRFHAAAERSSRIAAKANKDTFKYAQQLRVRVFISARRLLDNGRYRLQVNSCLHFSLRALMILTLENQAVMKGCDYCKTFLRLSILVSFIRKLNKHEY